MAKSYKYTKDTRPHIPSREEAGTEAASNVVQEKQELYLPKNPVVHRGQDPELFWMNKYGNDNRDDLLRVDLRSLYRHEHIAPEQLVKGLYRTVEEKRDPDQGDLFNVNELFGNALDKDELEKVSGYYTHTDGWSNRLILGDSLLVTSSLLEREGMAGKVQMIYIDPPYGIKYNSNWQLKLGDRKVQDGKDEHVSGEPETIKAFRDTWELGIHSYLSYLRDRLLVAKELLTVSGSCFVQISDENVHLVRNLMDEVFGSDNYISQVAVKKTGGKAGAQLDSVMDYIVWYGKSLEQTKYRRLFTEKEIGVGKGTGERYDQIELSDGTRRPLSKEEKSNAKLLAPLVTAGARLYQLTALISESGSASTSFAVELNGKTFYRTNWKTSEKGFTNLLKAKRIVVAGTTLRYVRYFSDFPATAVANYWDDTGLSDKIYVVQTADKVIQRCLLMCTDPGDLVLDPTCGSGTTAAVAEQWGRRWITIDTSRIALNVAKTRLMTATFPYYHLYSDVNVRTDVKEGKIKKTITEKPEAERNADVRQGFVYEEVPHITLKSLANDEQPTTETLYDKPAEDRKRMRVAGPFTVETLQNYDPVPVSALEGQEADADGGDEHFEETIFQHLMSAGIKTGIKEEKAIFTRVDRLTSGALHAKGFYPADKEEKTAYFHIGPKFGTVSKKAVGDAIKECRKHKDADWLVILGFSFENEVVNETITTSLGSFKVTKVRMHDDLMQDGLLKKDRKAGSFITIGEPDVALIAMGAPEAEKPKAAKAKKPKAKAAEKAEPTEAHVQVEIRGLDIYDPIKDEVKARDRHDIAYWMVDDDYDGNNFVVKQVFFCGGDKDEFTKWEKGLSNLSKASTKRNAERTLRIELDDDAFDRLYGFLSHPIPATPGRQIAVRIVSQFGEESMKVLEV